MLFRYLILLAVVSCSFIIACKQTRSGNTASDAVLATVPKITYKAKSNQLSDSLLFANKALEMGKIHYDWGQYDSSLVCFTKAHETAVLLHDTLLMAHSSYQIGKYFHTTGIFGSSMAYYQKALSLLGVCDDKPLKVNVLLSIGKNYLNQGNTAKALSHYQDAYQLSQQQGDLLAKADACNHLGSVYLRLMKPQLSIGYHRQALQWRIEVMNFNGMAKSHNNLGESFLAMDMPDSALYHFGKSLEASKKVNYHKGTVKALNNMSAIYVSKGSYHDAVEAITKAMRLSLESGYREGAAEAYCAMGGLNHQAQKYTEAIDDFNQALAIAQEVKRNDLVARCFNGQYLAFKALGMHPQALDAHEKASAMELEQLEMAKNRQIAEMHILFESDKKERENIMLKQQNELHALSISRKNKLLAVSFVSVLFLLVIVALIYLRMQSNKKAKQAMQVLNTQLELAVGERDKLLSIIAHELRNPLYWFQNLTKTLSQKHKHMSAESIEKSLASLDESAQNAFHLMDNLLNWSRTRLNRVSPKQKKVQILTLINQNKRLFETIVNQKKIDVKISCEDELCVWADEDLLDTIVRNLLSNAIKYTPQNGIIAIGCKPQDGFVRLEIADSGQGISAELRQAFLLNEPMTTSHGLLNEKGSGFGLKLCKEFTDLIGGKMGVGHSRWGGACFWVMIPLAFTNLPVSQGEVAVALVTD